MREEQHDLVHEITASTYVLVYMYMCTSTYVHVYICNFVAGVLESKTYVWLKKVNVHTVVCHLYQVSRPTYKLFL